MGLSGPFSVTLDPKKLFHCEGCWLLPLSFVVSAIV